jgi:hypothetical protein
MFILILFSNVRLSYALPPGQCYYEINISSVVSYVNYKMSSLINLLLKPEIDLELCEIEPCKI